MCERNIGWLPLAHSQMGTWPATQACALTRNPTSDLLITRRVLNPLSHTSQGCLSLFWNFNTFWTEHPTFSFCTGLRKLCSQSCLLNKHAIWVKALQSCRAPIYTIAANIRDPSYECQGSTSHIITHVKAPAGQFLVAISSSHLPTPQTYSWGRNSVFTIQI